MRTFKVNVIEHNEGQIEVEAETEEKAIEKAHEMYDNNEIPMLDFWRDTGYADFEITRSP